MAAGLLLCAIYVTANSTQRSREKALADAESQAQATGNEAAHASRPWNEKTPISANNSNSPRPSWIRKPEKLAAAGQETLQLQSDIEAALKQVAELSRKYADARIKQAEEAKASR